VVPIFPNPTSRSVKTGNQKNRKSGIWKILQYSGHP
jgi:hypothetical protein